MSLRSRVRELEELRALHREDLQELFRRSEVQLELSGLAVNAFKAVERELSRLDSEACNLAVEVGGDVGDLQHRLAALEDAERQRNVLPFDGELALSIAADEQRVVTFKYRDREGKSAYRVVSPYELQEKVGHTNRSLEPSVERFLSLLAWDHGREGIRHFRVERIEGAVTATNVETYRPPQDG